MEGSTTLPGADAPTPEDAVDAGVAKANAQTGKPEATEVEKADVDKLMKDYEAARRFDSPQYKQMERDRSYATGKAGAAWAVNANLLGSYIDILVSFIYARNPKVSIRPGEQVRRAADDERTYFAKTLQIVVQRMWKTGKLKKAMKRVVRAGFTVSTGWFKAVMLFDTKTDPDIEHELNDVRDNLLQIRALEEAILDPEVDGGEPIKKEVKVAELERQIEALEAQVEVVLRKGMAIDFVSSEQMQIALDVRAIDDYLEAGWCSDASFMRKDEALAKYPLLSYEELKTAKTYFQRAPTEYSRLEADPGNNMGASSDGILELDSMGMAAQYSTSPGYDGQAKDGSGNTVEFVKRIEFWDRRDVHIKTVIEGVKKWAKAPFVPQFATSRFYPYFKVDFFEVDGERWAQSLTYRLFRLQDEYGATRSNYRLTRQRAIPGTFFNAGQIDDESMKRTQQAVQDEFIPIKPKDPAADLNKLFAPKPLPVMDLALFDTSPIIGDMEKISGVQEALQTSQTVDKTATQAKIEQSGFAARSTHERDCVEEVLGELASHCAEIALQAFTLEEVQQVAGPGASWPEDLPIEAVTTLLDVEIEAGSTARPNQDQEREDWLTFEPLIEKLITIAYTQLPGSPVTKAYVELIRESFSRFDDRIDVERFLPGLDVDAPLPLPGLPGAPGAPGAPGGPPAPGGAKPGAAPPVGAGGAPAPVIPGEGQQAQNVDPIASANV